MSIHDIKMLAKGQHPDPFSVLGPHQKGSVIVVRVILPQAESVSIAEHNLVLQRIEGTDVFEWCGNPNHIPVHYRLIWRDKGHHEHICHDPYSYAPQLDPVELQRFAGGTHYRAQHLLGARNHEVAGVAGVLFSVWAPHVARASVVGDFNSWDGRTHPMRLHPGQGVWELFIPDYSGEECYKFEFLSADNGYTHLKSDPYGRYFQHRPETASIVEPPSYFCWRDKAWLRARANQNWLQAPMAIFEVHLGSWQRGPEGEMLNYRNLGQRLLAYVQEMGFSHIELLPLSEHPYDPSWGYQTIGYFAPTSRFGKPDDFRYFVDLMHRNGIGVILDWVPAHFPKDAHGLARFDGTALYEHEDPRKGEHLNWSTLIFNYGRLEVKSFLISSALFMLEEYHLDGLRVDAVSSMLYLDYSRTDWIPNQYGGRENLEAIDFLRELNVVLHRELPGILIMAEESTSWPQVSRPTYLGGLGFDLKWNMGWMNDSLSFLAKDPIYRRYHHEKLTFSLLYAFTENFLLPLSHDEVVHGKKSLLHKMPGDEWQQFANLRLLYTYMYTHPGKKLLFMGSEFAQKNEWNSESSLDWDVLSNPFHQGIQNLVKDLNRLYRQNPAFYRYEFDWQGFEWIDCHDAEQSVLSFIRRADEAFVIVLLNCTPVPRTGYRIGVPQAGQYQEIFNSDSKYYGGTNLGNGATLLSTENWEWMGQPCSIWLTLPPLAGVILRSVGK